MNKELISPETREALREFASAIVSEMRKPEPLTEQQEAAIKTSQADRRATAEGIQKQLAQKRFEQEHVCTHEHLSGAGGGTHCVG